MDLDNSAADAFRECPQKFFNSYLAEGTGIEARPISEYGPLDLGKRIHELLEQHYAFIAGGIDTSNAEEFPQYAPSENPDLEAEAQLIMAAYKQHYPVESFVVVDCERTIRVALPNSSHVYTGKIDLCVRHPNGSLSIIDHKTEKRTSRGNTPEAWAARDQATLYLWAAEQIYGEPIESFYVNVLRRPDKKNAPEFPERQKLERTPAQIEKALRDITLIADHIEDYRSRFPNSEWPRYTKNCIGRYGRCEFFTPCVYGWSEDIRRLQYQPKTPYLTLDGVKIIQNNS